MATTFRVARRLLLASALLSSPGALAALQPAPVAADRWGAWLQEVAPLLTEAERQAFLALTEESRREAFVEAFWEARDPFPETPANELRDAWGERLAAARGRFRDLSGDRSRMLLLAGVPRELAPSRCPQLLRPHEIWSYRGIGPERRDFVALFLLEPGGGRDPYRLWSAGDDLLELFQPAVLPASEPELLERVERECFRGRDLRDVVRRAVDWRTLERDIRPVPRPGPEWLRTFLTRCTDLPDNAATFPARFGLRFPARHQNRTVVQPIVSVPLATAGVRQGPAGATHSFMVDGEVWRQGKSFERFRYRFDFPAGESSGNELPLVVQRYLRPGDYTLVLRVEDLGAERFFRVVSPLRVPALAAGGEPASPAGEPAQSVAGPPAAEVAAVLAEADAALAADEHQVHLLPVPDDLLTGHLRVTARVQGAHIAKVRFSLDGRPVLSKRGEPYSVELDLGATPRAHRIEAEALAEDGAVLASDEIPVNAGPHRFGVRLLQPRRGGVYRQSLQAVAVVDLPRGERLDRVELYRNETLVATLYQPPFTQPILLPEKGGIQYVRAVAYLEDGYSAEDLVFVNAPRYLDRLQVDLVELYATVLEHGAPATAELGIDDFRVVEDGVEQQLLRVQRVTDLPIHAGVLLDTSTSMSPVLPVAESAALRFFQDVLTPHDRAAVITFSDEPRLTVPFTSDREVLAGGLEALEAGGETALYDSLVDALYYFSGVRGKRALVLISDGADSSSAFSFADVLDYARRAGVAIYTIGVRVPMRGLDVRGVLRRLARETGGRAYFIEQPGELGRVYREIGEEIHHQFLLVYQSSQQGEGFRRVEVKAERRGVEVRTIRGYIP